MNFVTTTYKDISMELFYSFKNVKIVIFDFDSTLYKGLSWDGYNEFFIKEVRQFFSNLSDKEFNFYLKKYNIINSDRVSENTAKMMTDFYGSAEKLVEFLKTVKYPTDWENSRIFPEKILKNLSKTKKLYIVSNSSKENIEYVSRNIGLNLKYFTNILPNHFDKLDLSKVVRLKEILLNESVSPNEILMVGDSVNYDLMPAKKLGFQCLLIND